MEKPTIPVSVVGRDDDDDYEDPLAPARGLVNGVLISALIWSLMFTALRMAGVV